MVQLGGFVQVLIYVGPWLIPRALGFYRSIKAASQGSQVREPPPRVRRCLNVLAATVVVSLILSLPFFAPPNIFQLTNSRLGLSGSLLVTRLNALRNGDLTDLDQLFLEKLETEPDRFRLMYAAYGPDATLRCPFCQANEPSSYLYYSLPAIAIPHLLHILLLGFITSSFFSGPEGSRWRMHATIAGVALAGAELYLTWNYSWEANGRKRMLNDIDFFYWRMRVWRQVAFAATDAIFGYMLWLTSTNRWLVKPPSTSHQLAELTQAVGATNAHISLLGSLRNTILRDNELRADQDAYWRREQEIMSAIMEDEGVRNAFNVVLSRTEHDQTRRRAQNYVSQVLDRMVPQQQSESNVADRRKRD